MLHKNIVSKSIALILLSLASICLYTEISLADINIDLSDEGYHLTRFAFPNEVSATLIRDHLYTSHLFKILDSRISLLRLSNICFLVISCGFFCHGFFFLFF